MKKLRRRDIIVSIVLILIIIGLIGSGVLYYLNYQTEKERLLLESQEQDSWLNEDYSDEDFEKDYSILYHETQEEFHKDPQVRKIREFLDGYVDYSNGDILNPEEIPGIFDYPEVAEDGCFVYLQGNLCPEDKEYFEKKFIVFNLEDFMFGGYYFYILFPEKLDAVWQVWVYSSVGPIEDDNCYVRDIYKIEDEDMVKELLETYPEIEEIFKYAI